MDREARSAARRERQAQRLQRQQEIIATRRAAGREGIKSVIGPRQDKALAGPAENKAEDDGLDDVAFAHPAGRTRARQLGMGADAFKRRRKSSERGFTTDDVERIHAATDEGDEG